MTDWKGRPEAGSRFAIWLIRGIARHGGRTVGRLLLYPITLYFTLVRGPERRGAGGGIRAFLSMLVETLVAGLLARVTDSYLKRGEWAE